MNTLNVLNVDLHCHSTVSDGVLAPEAVAARAHAHGVDIWALTDHDQVDGVAAAGQVARVLGMRFVPGVEISVTYSGQTVHIVGLGFDPGHLGLVAGLQDTRSGRRKRAVEIGQRLDALGMPGAYEGALQFVDNPEMIGRKHFARFLVEAGYCPNMQTVFARFLGDDCPGQVPVQWARLEQAVGWIRAAGGQAVVAHPGRYKFSPAQFNALFGDFIDLGGGAIEVITGSHTPDEWRRYAEVARRYGFKASRGSDFHSPEESRIDLGQLPPLPADLTPIWHEWF